MSGIIGLVTLVVLLVVIIRGHNNTKSLFDENSTKKEPQNNRREPLSKAAVDFYTANMDKAYDKLLQERKDVYPGFPWSAVYTPSTMRSILLGSNSLIDSPNYDLHLEGLGRFKLSIEAYAQYGVGPTKELIDYIEENGMNPDLDEAMAWYRNNHR